MASEPTGTLRQISALNEFVTDNPDLEDLKRLSEKFDALKFLGLSQNENTHSDILAWLLNPGENHGAADCFLKDFLAVTGALTHEEIRSCDWSGTTVRREWPNSVDDQPGSLDILVLNQGNNFVCAIENKINSSEHSNQLTRYRKALEARYPRLRKSCLFLSPHGDPPERTEDQGSWRSVDYRRVLDSVEYTLQEGVGQENPAVAAFLKQYITTLRRNIVPDTNVQQLATRIYLQHREAVDLIIRHREAYIEDLKQFCKEAIMEHGHWTFVSPQDDGTPDRLVGFFHDDWKRYESFCAGKGWNRESDGALRFHFDLRNPGEVTLILTIPQGDMHDATRRALFDMGQGRPDLFDHKGHRYGGDYTGNWIRLHVSEPVLSEEDFLNWDMNGARQKILSWVGKFAADDFPVMHKAIVACFRNVDATLG